MLEILAVWWLARLNGKNAALRGHKPTGFKILTVVLWFGFEFAGGIASGIIIAYGGYYATDRWSIYTIMLICALLGGSISYLAARFCPKGSYVSKDTQILQDIFQHNYELNLPASVDIIRERAFTGAFLTYNFFLNGKAVGPLKNDTHMVIRTDRVRNVVTAEDAYGNKMKEPFYFEIGDNGQAEIYFKAGKFLPGRAKITPV